MEPDPYPNPLEDTIVQAKQYLYLLAEENIPKHVFKSLISRKFSAGIWKPVMEELIQSSIITSSKDIFIVNQNSLEFESGFSFDELVDDIISYFIKFFNIKSKEKKFEKDCLSLLPLIKSLLKLNFGDIDQKWTTCIFCIDFLLHIKNNEYYYIK